MLNFESLQKDENMMFALVMMQPTQKEYDALELVLQEATREYTISVKSKITDLAFQDMMRTVIRFVEERIRATLDREVYFAYVQTPGFFEIHVDVPPTPGMAIAPSFHRIQ